MNTVLFYRDESPESKEVEEGLRSRGVDYQTVDPEMTSGAEPPLLSSAYPGRQVVYATD